MTIFVDFGLGADCNMMHWFMMRTGIGLSWWRRIVQFLSLKRCFFCFVLTWV